MGGSHTAAFKALFDRKISLDFIILTQTIAFDTFADTFREEIEWGHERSGESGRARRERKSYFNKNLFCDFYCRSGGWMPHVYL